MFSLLLIWSGWTIFLGRLILGIIMIIHGLPKIKNLKGTAEWFNSSGFKPGIFWGTIVAILEFFGGIFLIFGFLTQVIALLLAIQFIVILVWKILKHQSFNAFELDLLILALVFILLFNGSGELSLDKFFGIF
ncbi:MAG: DoxX family protein [Minisyncoccia bacterium]